MKQRTIYVSKLFPGASIAAKTQYCIAAGLRAGREGIDLERDPEPDDLAKAEQFYIKSIKLMDDEAEVVIEGSDDLMDEYERALRIIE